MLTSFGTASDSAFLPSNLLLILSRRRRSKSNSRSRSRSHTPRRSSRTIDRRSPTPDDMPVMLVSLERCSHLMIAFECRGLTRRVTCDCSGMYPPPNVETPLTLENKGAQLLKKMGMLDLVYRGGKSFIHYPVTVEYYSVTCHIGICHTLQAGVVLALARQSRASSTQSRRLKCAAAATCTKASARITTTRLRRSGKTNPGTSYKNSKSETRCFRR